MSITSKRAFTVFVDSAEVPCTPITNIITTRTSKLATKSTNGTKKGLSSSKVHNEKENIDPKSGLRVSTSISTRSITHDQNSSAPRASGKPRTALTRTKSSPERATGKKAGPVKLGRTQSAKNIHDAARARSIRSSSPPRSPTRSSSSSFLASILEQPVDAFDLDTILAASIPMPPSDDEDMTDDEDVYVGRSRDASGITCRSV